MLNTITPDTLAHDPIERAETIPSSWYVDRAIHDFEREAIFLRSWCYVGHVGALANAGDYLTATVADNPIIVVRGKDETIRAFYNVCRHRGGPLATDHQGNGRMLRCLYHGWTYRLDGTLRGVPRFDRSELFDKEDYGLVPVEVAEWEGLLFVRLEKGDVELEEMTEGIRERIAPLRLGAMSFHARVVYDVACNWKVYVDNYLEGYHIPLVHPELCRTLDYAAYATDLARRYSLQHSPFRDASGDNAYGIVDGTAFYYCIFPNLMLNILPGRLQINLVLPTAPDRCSVIFDFYYDDVTSPEALARIADDLAFSDEVQKEDIDICEHVQKGLASRGYDRGRFSPECEEGVHHFQGLIKEAYGREKGKGREGKGEDD